MRILLTGAGGNLGRAAVPALEQAGHQLRLLDFRPLTTDHEFVQGDVSDKAVVTEAMADVDVVIHGAALHGIHLEAWPASDFWSTNVDGTFVVYEAAREAGVRHVVLASSMVVYGGVGGQSDRWTVVTEQSPIRPADLYGLTKVVAEDTARFYADVHGMRTVALRLGMFVPETFERYGFRLLFGGVDDRDVGQAVSRALEHRPAGGFAAYNIMADGGFPASDASNLDADIAKTLEQRIPGTLDLVHEHGLDLDELIWGRSLFPVDSAVDALGYRPRYDFAAFLDAWRRGDTGHYPYADEPRWGVEGPAARSA